MKRDSTERGRTVPSIIAQYQKYVKPAYDNYIHPVCVVVGFNGVD